MPSSRRPRRTCTAPIADTIITATDAAPPAEATAPARLLQLVWLASPALPVGGFSYSEGLEAAVDSGLVHDEGSATTHLLDQLVLGLASCELGVVVQALDAWQRDDSAGARTLNDWFLATRESAELRLQTEQMGRSLAAWLQQRHTGGTRTARDACAELSALTPAPAYPIAFALACACADASARDAALVYAFGWAENMVQAAVKAVPLGQSAGQRVLGALADAIPGAVQHALSLEADELLASLPALAILSARHETQYSRLFRS